MQEPALTLADLRHAFEELPAHLPRHDLETFARRNQLLSGGYREGLIGAALITDACTGPLAVLEGVSADAPGCADALSYSQALAFSDYLIRTCGLSAFLDYCLEPDAAFAEICGMEFEAAMTAWLEELPG